MRSVLIVMLLSGIILSMVCSCATVSKEPLVPDEIRLLSMDVVGAGVDANIPFAVNVFFEASDNPKIKRVCFYEQGEEPLYFDALDISYATLGTKRVFQVRLPGLRAGFHRVECYVEYIRDGRTVKSNVIFTGITPKVGMGG